jgi:hypothetical protein
VLVFAYFNRARALTVSVDLDTTEPRWLRNSALPMRVTVNGVHVFDAAGPDATPTFARVVADISRDERAALRAALDAADAASAASDAVSVTRC